MKDQFGLGGLVSSFKGVEKGKHVTVNRPPRGTYYCKVTIEVSLDTV
jgi:hypothetical protein